MKIVIAGCGKIGKSVVESLVRGGHDVFVIDTDEAVCKKVGDVYDVQCFIGNATDHDALVEAGVKDAELFASLTCDDESNLLACFMAKNLGAKKVIARVRNPHYYKTEESIEVLRRDLGIDLAINPDKLVAEELLRMLQIPSALKTETFLKGRFEIVEVPVKDDSVLCGKSLAELRQKYKSRFLVCCVKRGGEVYIPDGSFVVEKGDTIGITSLTGEMAKVLSSIGMGSPLCKNVMIVGGSRIAMYLCRELEKTGAKIKIIERNPDVCNYLSDVLEKTSVVLGNGTDDEVLLEEGIMNSDAFITLTGLDELNLLMAYRALELKVPKVVPKINTKSFHNTARTLNLDTIITPHNVIALLFDRYARALENSLGSIIESLYRFMDERVEAAEFVIEEDWKYTGIPLKDLKLKPNILVAAMKRGNRVTTPTGDDSFKVGDSVVIVSVDSVANLSDIIKK